MKRKLLLSIPLLLLFITGCSQKPASNVDTPDYHFSAGMRLIDQEDYNGAIVSFEHAKDLDKIFAPAYGGLAIANAHLGDAKKAEYYVEEAKAKGGKDADVLTLCGQAWIVMRNDKKNWFKKAEDVLEKALKRNENHEGALYYLGLANLYNYEFSEAESYFRRVVDQKGSYAGKADDKWQLSQKIVRAMPGTTVGKKVALQDKITRADLSVLFVEELKFADLMSKMPQQSHGFQTPSQMAAQQVQSSPSDASGHWAEVWINDAVNFLIMDVFPDGKFYPDETITRAGYAMAVQRLLVTATRDYSLETRYFGENPSRFGDVPSSHPAYNAMALCSERGIMKADVITGHFNPNGFINGADALLIIRTIQTSLHQTF